MFLLAIAFDLPAVAAADRPNVVLILADDLGWADLGCYGSKLQNTPHLDRLAMQGLRFTEAYSAQPICSPSRAALLTGKAPARLHLTEFIPGRRVMPSQKLLRPDTRQELPLEEITLAEHLKAAGYVTACLGKWHLGGKGFGPLDQGFDVAFEPPGVSQPSASEGGKSEYLITARAEEFIEENKEHPFFCYIAHHSPHIPLAANSNLVAKYKNTANPTYAAMLETLDDCVGRILAKLDTLGLATNTLVLFTSDNGGLSVVEHVNTPATSNFPLRAGKGHLYEGGIRIPLVMRWPGKLPAGRLVKAPVINTDFTPTILELSGLTPPAGLDGISLAALLTKNNPPVRNTLFWHYPHYPNQKGQPSGAIRNGDWKLIEFFESGHTELYHLATDPGESQNLAISEPHRVRELRAQLASWRGQVGAQMPTPNPGYDPAAAWTTVFQGKDGTLRLDSSVAEVSGSMLRYEPAPHKNTLGYWTRVEDWCRWDVEIEQPGEFEIELLQGCGQGSGGAEVEIAIAEYPFKNVVEETGHFQNFVSRVGGKAMLGPGHYSLTVKPKTKPGAAVMDLRAVTLRPVSASPLRQALTFHASFDRGLDADYGLGDRTLRHAASMKKMAEGTSGLPTTGEVELARGDGRFGDALRFTRKKSPVVFYPALANLAYRTNDWSGTVSFWLSVDPAVDLEPGYCDPIQITPRVWNDAAFFVEFEKRTNAVPFRLGVYADYNVWNPGRRDWGDIPLAEKPLITVPDPPFQRGKWTHVVFTFEHFNSGREDGVARLYLDGAPAGELSPRRQTFSWNSAECLIMMGVGYLGLWDELAVFNRAFTDAEVRALHALPSGVGELHR